MGCDYIKSFFNATSRNRFFHVFLSFPRLNVTQNFNSMEKIIFGNARTNSLNVPFALNFASLQENVVAAMDELPYDAKLQVSNFSMQPNKTWTSGKTCTVLTPVGNDPKDRVYDYNVPD